MVQLGAVVFRQLAIVGKFQIWLIALLIAEFFIILFQFFF